MKKRLLLLMILVSLLSIFIVRVDAYSPHYLPGGKNYISSDNIIKVGEQVSTINPFLVKPYTDYTFSIERYYTDGREFIMTISFYDDDILLSQLNLDDSIMQLTPDGSSMFYTFKTPVETNYMEFEFRDNGSYVSGTELTNVQLEEGTLPTAYEPYIEGNILDTSSPYFIGSSTIISYFDQPITLAEIQASLSAYDDVDGDLTDNIIVLEDNYSANIGVLGSYTINFSVSDNSGNVTNTTITVEVIDILPPVFSNIENITAVYPNVYSQEDIIAMLSASDNYDGDVSSNITVTSDDYSANASIIGTYQMEFKVSDSSGNETTYIQNITVVDNEGPVISGIDNLSIGYDQSLTHNMILANLSVVDNYDDASTLQFVVESDNYSANKDELGSYEIRVSVTDSSGNKTIKVVTINVVDAIGPVVYFNSSVIQVYSDTVLSLPDFAKLLVKTNELDINSDYFIKVRYDSYTPYSNLPGTYHIYLDFEDGYGRITSKNFEVRVVERGYDGVYIHENTGEITKPNTISTLIYSVAGSVSLVGVGGIIVILKIYKKKHFKL